MSNPLPIAIEYVAGWDRLPDGGIVLPNIDAEINFNIRDFLPLYPKDSVARIKIFVRPPSFDNFKTWSVIFSIGGLKISEHYVSTARGQFITLPDISLQQIDQIVNLTVHFRDLGHQFDEPDALPKGDYFELVEATIEFESVFVNRSVIAIAQELSDRHRPSDMAHDVWANAERLVDLILQAKSDKQPFSVVRLGDGEGRILGYPNYFNNVDILFEVLRYQYGEIGVTRLREKYGADGIRFATNILKDFIDSAVRNAGAIGLPSSQHLSDRVVNGNAHATLGFSAAWVGSNEILKALNNIEIFDTFIFRGINRLGYFGRILEGLPFLGLVSHTDLSSPIAKKFCVDNIYHVSVPGHQGFMPSFEAHFPDAYLKVIRNLKVPFQGAIYLVGAGYLGKLYCEVVRQRGGIALDIGSVFDEWSGIGRPDALEEGRLKIV